MLFLIKQKNKRKWMKKWWNWWRWWWINSSTTSLRNKELKYEWKSNEEIEDIEYLELDFNH